MGYYRNASDPPQMPATPRGDNDKESSENIRIFSYILVEQIVIIW